MLTYNGIVVLKYNCCIEVQMHSYRSTIYHLSLMQMYCEDKARFLCGTPALYGNPTLSRHRLGCYCGMFHLQHTNGTYCNNIYTGEIQTSNYLRICPKWNFFVTITINIIWSMWQRSQKATFLPPSNIEEHRRYYWRKIEIYSLSLK